MFLHYIPLCQCGHVYSQTSVVSRHEEFSRILSNAIVRVVAFQCQVSSITILIHTVLLWDIHSDEDVIANNVKKLYS